MTKNVASVPTVGSFFPIVYIPDVPPSPASMTLIGIGSSQAMGVPAIGEPVMPMSLAPDLWLDASQSGTITHSGGLVSNWGDASGNGNDFSNTANKPVTNAASQNSLNIITFDGTQYLNTVAALAHWV